MPSTKHYKAFISYSHDNEEFGAWLHEQLEKYKIPKKLREDYPHLPKTLYPIFRDKYELNAGDNLGNAEDNLGEDILNALKNSDALIVICSIKSASSKWVNKEIIDFKIEHGEARIFPIIVDGVPFARESENHDDSLECFPEPLKYEIDLDGKLTSKRTNKLASDFNKSEDGEELAKLQLIAGVLGVPFGEFYKRDVIYKEEELIKIKKQKEDLEKAKNEANEQLIISKNKTKLLQSLTKKTIRTLIYIRNGKILFNYLKMTLNSGDRDIFIEMLKSLIKEAQSMDENEKSYWLNNNKLRYMANKDLFKLTESLITESVKLTTLEYDYQHKILNLNQKHLKEWKDFSKGYCINQKDKSSCLSVIESVLKFPFVLDKEESIIDYFKLYKRFDSKPNAKYYNLYGQYLLKKNRKQCAIKLFKKAVSMEQDNIDFLTNLIDNINNIEKTLTLQNKVIHLREKKMKNIDENYFKHLNKELENEEINLIKIKKVDIYMDMFNDINKLFSIEAQINPDNLIFKSYLKYYSFIKYMLNEDLATIDPRIATVSDSNLEKEESKKSTIETNSKKNLKTYISINESLIVAYSKLKMYKEAIKNNKKILTISSNLKVIQNNSWIASKYLSLSWYYLLSGEYKETIKYCNKAIEINISGAIGYEVNMAHAYLLLGDFESAKNIYLKNIGNEVFYWLLWEEAIKEDFEILKKEKIYNNDFIKIEELIKNKLIIK